MPETALCTKNPDRGLSGSAHRKGPGLIPMRDPADNASGGLGAEADLNQIPLQLIQGVRLERD
jgi:hypothetical protein